MSSEPEASSTNAINEIVDDIINSFKSLKPPFICPIDNCSKPCLGLMSLKHHLLKVHKERLSQDKQSEEDGAGSDDAHEKSISSQVAKISAIRKKKKRGRMRFGNSRKSASRSSLAAGNTTEDDEESGAGGKGKNNTLSPTSAAHYNMTYEESLRVAMFQVNNRSYRVEIDEPLQLKFIDPPRPQDTTTQLNSTSAPETTAASKSSGSKSKGTKSAMKSKKPVKKDIKKLPEAEVRWFQNPPVIHSKPHVVPKEYREYKEKTPEELDKEVEYVMDDLDYAWLRLYNSENRVQKCLPEVSNKDFELLMDRLEKDSRLDPSAVANNMGSQGGASGGMGGDEPEDDAVCSICQDGEANNTNVILFCDMCNLPVHQECYGVPYIPEGQWVCRKCLLSPAQPVTCQLCPMKTGAFKQTSKNKWCHVSCAIWIPEVQFANAVFLEPIENLESIPAARFKLCCYICKKRNAGACVQCSKNNCFTAFHIACGQSAGLHIKLEPINSSDHSPTLFNVKKVAYCDLHTPADSDRKPLINSAAPEDSKNSKKLKQIFAQNKSQASSQVQVPLPEISADKYEQIVARVSFPHKVQFLTRLTSYWLLRRQALNGLPLIKRLHMTHLQKQQHSAQAALEKCENDNIGAPNEETSADTDAGRILVGAASIDPSTSANPKRSVKASKMKSKTSAKCVLRQVNCKTSNLGKRRGKQRTRKCIADYQTDDESSDNLSLAKVETFSNGGLFKSLELGFALDSDEQNPSSMGNAIPSRGVKNENVKSEPTLDIEVPNEDNDNADDSSEFHEVKEESNLLEYDDEEFVEWQQLYVGGSNPGGNPLSVSCSYPSSSSYSGTPHNDRLLYCSMDNRMTASDLEQLKLTHKEAAGALRDAMNDFRKVYREVIKYPPSNEFYDHQYSKEHNGGKRSRRKKGLSGSAIVSFCPPDLFTDDAEIIPLPAFKSEESVKKYGERTPQIHQPGRRVVDDFSEAPVSSKSESRVNCKVTLGVGGAGLVRSCNDLEPPDGIEGSLPLVTTDEKEEPSSIPDDEFVTKPKKRYYPRMKEQMPEKCAAFLNLSYDDTLTLEFERIIAEMNLNSIESCCQELIKLRKISEQKQARLYHSIAQGKVLTHLKAFTDSEKHLDNILKSRSIQLESTQRNNYSKLYRFYLKYKQICNYNTSSSYVIKNFPLVKRVFEAGLVIT